MRDFAKAFYSSGAWKECREAYKKSVAGLCEECLKHGYYVPGDAVHHKVHLTPENVNDPSISLNWDNLQLLCRDCHAKMHSSPKRYKFDQYGRLIIT
jgi:5-methylcytosine-specific restriction endonuclease McrA